MLHPVVKYSISIGAAVLGCQVKGSPADSAQDAAVLMTPSTTNPEGILILAPSHTAMHKNSHG